MMVNSAFIAFMMRITRRRLYPSLRTEVLLFWKYVYFLFPTAGCADFSGLIVGCCLFDHAIPLVVLLQVILQDRSCMVLAQLRVSVLTSYAQPHELARAVKG